MKFALFTVLLLLVSCGTSHKYIADDIYVLKPSELSIGESSADETSYSAFKKRKEGSARNEQQMYTNQYFMASYRNCLSQPFWYNGCGCSYAFWAQNSPYSVHYGSMSFGHYQGLGYGYNYGPYGSFYTTAYYSPDFGVYYGTPYYNPYNGAYYNPYGYSYGYSAFGGYGYGGNWYYGNNTSNHGLNHSNGPRGSAAGFSNPNGRQAHAGPVKSGVVSQPVNSHASNATSAKSAPVRKPISAINTTPVSRPTSTNGTITRNSGTVSRNPSNTQGRTYEKSTAAPTRTYTPPVTRSSSPSNGHNSSGTVTRSGTPNSAGNSSSGTTRSSGSSSSPRSNSTQGRRP